MKSFYEFEGSWLQIFDHLVGIITPANIERFAIWQPKVAGPRNLLIVYGLCLDSDWERVAGTKKISETEFLRDYKAKIAEHRIHGFNEYEKGGKQLLAFSRKISALL